MVQLKGAIVQIILPYKHLAPDFNISQQLYREIIEGSVDAVCFTTAVQVNIFMNLSKHMRIIKKLWNVSGTGCSRLQLAE